MEKTKEPFPRLPEVTRGEDTKGAYIQIDGKKFRRAVSAGHYIKREYLVSAEVAMKKVMEGF